MTPSSQATVFRNAMAKIWQEPTSTIIHLKLLDHEYSNYDKAKAVLDDLSLISNDSPGLIMVHCLGFGHTSPEVRRLAHFKCIELVEKAAIIVPPRTEFMVRLMLKPILKFDEVDYQFFSNKEKAEEWLLVNDAQSAAS